MDALNQLMERGFDGVMLHHILTIIILIVSFFSSLILGLNKGGNYRSNRFLSGFFIAIGCIESLFFISSVNDDILGIYALPFIVTFILLLAPLASLYVEKTTQPNRRVSPYNLSIPLSIGLFIISLILLERCIGSLAIAKSLDFILRKVVLLSIVVFLPLQVFYYILKMYRMVKQHKENIAEYFSYQEGINLQWIQIFALGFSIFILGCFVFEMSDSSVDNLFFKAYILVYTVLIALFGIRQTNIYSDFELDSNTHVQAPAAYPTTPFKDSDINKRYKGSSLKNVDKILDIETQLQEYLIEEKAYLNPKLNLKNVAKELGINYKYLSQVINTKYNCSFIHLINNYRIESAKLLLMQSDKTSNSIEQIGYMAGFQSKSAFYSNFKKHLGKTPVQFRKEQS